MRIFLVLVAFSAGSVTFASQERSRVLDCRASADFGTTSADLVKRFGAASVENRQIYLGEGFYEPGTVLFADSPAQLDILWKDSEKHLYPTRMRIKGDRSDWASADGITLGTDLRTLERLNRRPFRLLGFAWDYDGTVMSWEGGGLAQADSGKCRLRMRLTPTPLQSGRPSYQQVQGDREFSSGHPAMQDLNPHVYEMWLDLSQ